MVLLNMLHYAASMQQYAANGPFAIRAHIRVVFLTSKNPYSQIFMLGTGFAASKLLHLWLDATSMQLQGDGGGGGQMKVW